jgi:hypothetical protein
MIANRTDLLLFARYNIFPPPYAPNQGQHRNAFGGHAWGRGVALGGR